MRELRSCKVRLYFVASDCKALARSKKRKHLHAPSIRRRCTLIARAEAHYTCTSQHSTCTALMTLLDHHAPKSATTRLKRTKRMRSTAY